MALPIIDTTLTVHQATKNVIKYIKDTDSIERIFKIEQLRVYINKTDNAFTPYLIHTLNMYQ